MWTMKKIDEQKSAELLKGSDNILILTHRNPDGDTLGSAFALLHALKSLGKNVVVDCSDQIHQKYSYMWQDNESIYCEKSSKAFSPDFVVAVDVADEKLLGSELLEKYGSSIPLCIDHHISNTEYAENLCLRERSATCEIIFDVVKILGVKINKIIADCIYTGITTDTGCFRYSSVTPDTHIKAAELIGCGADFSNINRIMFETKTRSYFRLEELVLKSIEMYFSGKCAVVTITQDMFKESGSNESECDGIASLPRKIDGVLAGITFRERTDGSYKVSLRTYAPVDAAKICGYLGGGGHARAAGCDFGSDYSAHKEKLLELIKTEIEKV